MMPSRLDDRSYDGYLRLYLPLRASRGALWALLTGAAGEADWWLENMGLEPRPGGLLKGYRRDRKGRNVRIDGQVTVFEPPQRLHLAWREEGWRHESHVAIEIEDGAGDVVLGLVHSGWEGVPASLRAGLVEEYTAAWSGYLEKLGARAENAGHG